ncbi:integrase core domain-containing protein [Arthrobacter sp. LAPM80]|uniref:integrase core domain-containing protein n=1 Tax=Arthrobacter sp. LAPM80 TaxID=3141788 RepID=UPI00398AECBB
MAFNQLRQGSIGSVEIFLGSKGTMPISGLPGKRTTQGKNKHSHQMLQRFLEANKHHNLAELQIRLKHYREHYNRRRPHQSLNQSTSQMAWDMLERTPAIEPLPLAALEAKAWEYRRVSNMRRAELGKVNITVSKTGEILDVDILGAPPTAGLAPNQMVIEGMREQGRIFYQGNHISVPTTFAGRLFHRTVTDTEFLLWDPV